MDFRQVNWLITVFVALGVRQLIRIRNKSKNSAFYADLGRKDPAEVTHLWLKTMARHAIPFQYTLFAEAIISLTALIIFDYFYPGFAQITIPLAGLAIFLRANNAWMKIIYIKNLDPSSRANVIAYFNENSKSSIEKALQDPEILAFFKPLPKFLVNLISKGMRAIKPINSL